MSIMNCIIPKMNGLELAKGQVTELMLQMMPIAWNIYFKNLQFDDVDCLELNLFPFTLGTKAMSVLDSSLAASISQDRVYSQCQSPSNTHSLSPMLCRSILMAPQMPFPMARWDQAV